MKFKYFLRQQALPAALCYIICARRFSLVSWLSPPSCCKSDSVDIKAVRVPSLWRSCVSLIGALFCFGETYSLVHSQIWLACFESCKHNCLKTKVVSVCSIHFTLLWCDVSVNSFFIIICTRLCLTGYDHCSFYFNLLPCVPENSPKNIVLITKGCCKTLLTLWTASKSCIFHRYYVGKSENHQ